MAVLPFRPLDNSSKKQGLYLAEKFTTYLAQTGDVLVVERALLEDLQSEHHLAQIGFLDPEHLARLGRLLQAEAVVLGSFVSIGSTVEINVRLIHLESGVILEAGRQRIKGRLFNDYGTFPTPMRITSANAIEEVWAFQRGTPVRKPKYTRTKSTHRSRAPTTSQREKCRFSKERINSLIGSIVDLKARYWAHQVRKARLPRSTLHKPSQGIPDPALQARFHELVDIAAENKSPPLTMTEMKRFLTADREAFILNLQCPATNPTAQKPRNGSILAAHR